MINRTTNSKFRAVIKLGLHDGHEGTARTAAGACSESLFGERLQEAFTVVLELGWPDARDAQHLLVGFRSRAGHLQERRVREHHVRRNAALARDFLAQRAQSVEER